MIREGSWDEFPKAYQHGQHPPRNVAAALGQITPRASRDIFAVRFAGQGRSGAKGRPIQGPRFVPVKITTRRGARRFVDTDEHPKGTARPYGCWRSCVPASTRTARLLRALVRHQRGAAAVVLMDGGRGRKGGAVWASLARIVSLADRPAFGPADHGQRPIPAKPQWALKKAGLVAGQLDLIEDNEAFAAQAWRGQLRISAGCPRRSMSNGAAHQRSVIRSARLGRRVSGDLLQRDAARPNVKKGLANPLHRRRHGNWCNVSWRR